jgi:hypothetical protein
MGMFKAATLLASLLLLASTALARSNYAPGSLDPYFVIDWKLVPGPRGENIEGFVYNKANQPTDRMQLSIEALDEGGHIVGRSTTWVLGGVPPNNRTWFSTPAPAARAAGYRIEILSFDWVGRGP